MVFGAEQTRTEGDPVIIDVMQLVQLGVTVGAVVWVVASVKATTLKLGAEIAGLRESVDRLQSWLEGHAMQLNNHEGRIGTIEGRFDSRRGGDL